MNFFFNLFVLKIVYSLNKFFFLNNHAEVHTHVFGMYIPQLSNNNIPKYV